MEPAPRKRNAWRRRLEVLRNHARGHRVLHEIRYAALARIGRPETFSAHPRPAQAARAPRSLRAAIEAWHLADAPHSLETAERLAFHLSHGHARGGHIGSTTAEAFRRIREGGAGVCSDYSQVFLGLCAAQGIPSREWGVCETLRGIGMGHTLSEIYCEQRRAWVCVDPYWALCVEDAHGTPLSVQQVIRAAHRDPRRLRVRAIDAEAFSEQHRAGYLARYFGPGRLAFLLSKYDPLRQDRILERVRWLPLVLRHCVLILAGSYQRFDLYADDAMRDGVRRVLSEARRSAVRRVLLSAVVPMSLLGALALVR